MLRNEGTPSRADVAIAVAAHSPALHKRMTAEQGFRQIITACLAQIQGSRMTLIHDGDPESLHQMRVGLRRLRTALDLFRRIVPTPRTLRKQLDWLSSILGPARDWEVLRASTLAQFAAAAADNHDLHALLQAASVVARDLHEQARVAAQSPRFTDLLLTFSDWLEGAAWRKGMPKPRLERLEVSLPRFAEKSRKRSRRRMFRRVAKLNNAAPKTYHKLRIAAKRARYTVEFFRSLFATKRVACYIDRLAALQDELGQRNDAAVADRLLQELEDVRPDLHAGIGIVRDALRSKFNGKARRLHRLWTRFASSKTPKRK